MPTYAQVVGVVNRLAGDRDTMVTAAGGLPGETTKGWRVKTPHSFDCEFGFSCMGYEIAGGWGHAMAAPEGSTPIVMVGDGSYMMMNSDIWSSVLTGHKMIVVVCDNGGYAVINRLQNFKGVPSFNNLIKDSRVKEVVPVDFAKHAESMGALARHARQPRPISRRRWTGAQDRPHNRDLDCHRRAFLGAGGCRLGRGCARGERSRGNQGRSRRPGRHPPPSARRGCDMRAKLGISPIAWWNDDLVELSDDVSLDECLRQVAKAGYTGVETGRRFPLEAEALGAALAPHGLTVCGGWFSGQLLDSDVEAEKERIAPDARAVQGDRRALHRLRRNRRDDPGRPVRAAGHEARHRRGRHAGLWPAPHRLAQWCAGQGMPLSFHHHMGTAIETEAETDALMSNTGEALGLLFDAGHMAFAGGDVMRVIDRHHARISHVHTKDIRRSVIDDLDRSRESFLDAVIKGAFTVPGDGDLDFESMAKRLAGTATKAGSWWRRSRIRKPPRRWRWRRRGTRNCCASWRRQATRWRHEQDWTALSPSSPAARRALGAAIARRFADGGAAGHRHMRAQPREGCGKVAREDHRRQRRSRAFVEADLAQVDACRAVVAAAEGAFGRIDVLVNAAGLTDRGGILDSEPELFDRMIAVNTRAPFFLMQGAARLMVRDGVAGAVVNVGSMSETAGQPFIAPYCLSKGALATLTRNSGYALMRNRIRVNQLSIGWMASDGEDRIQREYHGAEAGWQERAGAEMPFGRLLDPDEVAAAVAFLASADAGMMTGAVVPFDQSVQGGYSFAPPTPEAPLSG